MSHKYVLMDDGKRYWPVSGMLAHSPADALVFETRGAAEAKRREVHARNPKGPFPWRVVAVETSAIEAWKFGFLSPSVVVKA